MKAQLLAGARAEFERVILELWTARLQVKLGDFEPGAQALGYVRERKSEGSSPLTDSLAEIGLPRVPNQRDLMVEEALALEKAERFSEVTEIYASLIKQEADDRILYGYANALRRSSKSEDRIKSRETFEKIVKSGKDVFWKRLAQEALALDRKPSGRP